MRFGHFFYPMKFDDSNDEQAIQECLDEAVLVEALGFDAIWIAEHYFTGECVYGDPLVFASAVAVKTSRIELGFGILELPCTTRCGLPSRPPCSTTSARAA